MYSLTIMRMTIVEIDIQNIIQPMINAGRRHSDVSILFLLSYARRHVTDVTTAPQWIKKSKKFMFPR